MAFISLDTEITYKTLNCCILLQDSLLIWFRNGKWYLRDRWIIQHALKQSVKFEFGDNLNIWAALITKKYLKQLNLNGSFRIKGFTSGNVFALVFLNIFIILPLRVFSEDLSELTGELIYRDCTHFIQTLEVCYLRRLYTCAYWYNW